MNKLRAHAVIDRGHSPFFRKDLLLLVMAATFLFGLAAHAYCYFNLSYSHDSLMVYQADDVTSQISIGRILLPAYLHIRGNFYAPWLVGMLSLAFLGLAAYLTVRLLNMESRLLCVLCCGVLAVNTTLTLTNATYIKDADVYMCSLLLATAAVYLWARAPYGMLPAAVALSLSLGLYQAFFQTAVFLCMVFIVRKILAGADAKRIFLMGVNAVASLLLGLLLYYAALRSVLAATNVAMSSSYNGLSKVGQFGGLDQLLKLIYETYSGAIFYFQRPEIIHGDWMAWLNLLLAAAAAALLVLLLLRRRIRGWSLVLLGLVLVLMPFGINVIYFISQGVDHELMHFSYYFFYVFAAMLLDEYWRDAPPEGRPLPGRVLGRVIPCVFIFFIFNSIIYANQTYLKKDLEYQATLLTMVRVVDRIEQIDGYVLGETPVAIMGELEQSGLSASRKGFSSLRGVGLKSNFALTYSFTYRWYFEQILGYPVNLLKGAAYDAVDKQKVAAMPVFPAPGSCAMVDGVVVVKFS